MPRSNNKILGNHGEEKERLQWEGFAEKEGINVELSMAADSGVNASATLEEGTRKALGSSCNE